MKTRLSSLQRLITEDETDFWWPFRDNKTIEYDQNATTTLKEIS